MRSKNQQQSDAGSIKKASFSKSVKTEVAAIPVRKEDDRKSIVAGILMPGNAVKGEALEICCKYKDGIGTSDENVDLDLENGARLFLRGVFLSCGYVTDPKSAYRIELRPAAGKAADTVSGILTGFDISYTKSKRGDVHVIYIRNGDAVSDFLGIIGANNARLEFENIRIEREMNSGINREVNCDSGNTGRQAEAAARRGELIGRLLESPEAEKLPAGLYEAAIVHQQNPGASIAELGAMMNPPIGKSGMNHRLTRLLEIADSM